MSRISLDAAEKGISLLAVRSFRSTFFCAAVLLGCILVSHPVVEAGVGDDWVYIWSARVLADTGHVVYAGWATAIVGWQLYLGAFFIKLFGFSFTAVRASIVLLSLICAALLHRIFLRLGLGDWNASIATLSVVLSSVFLPLATTFMSDVPGLFAILVCLYCCLRAVPEQSPAATIAWLAGAALSNDVLGTARQICWLGVLVLVPSAAWCVRRRRGVPVAAAALWLLSLAFVAGCMHWFSQQPYAVHEDFLFRYHRGHLEQAHALTLTALLLVLPVLSAYLFKLRTSRGVVGYAAALVGAATGCGLLLLDPSAYNQTHAMAAPFLGDVPLAVRLVLVGSAFACLFRFAAGLRSVLADPDAPPAFLRGLPGALPARTLLLLFGPFTCAYMLLVVTRESLWPRYIVPVLPIFLFFLIWVYIGDAPRRRLPILSAVIVAVLACEAVANTHDLFARQGAYAAAANRVLAAGVPRSQLEGGFELDGWAQLQSTGYVNDPNILVPAGAYKPRNLSGPPGCHGWFLDWTPSIQPRFTLSDVPSSCYPPAPFPQQRYRSWCPPHDRAVFISAIPAAVAAVAAGKPTPGAPPDEVPSNPADLSPPAMP
jgi:hypothetical protein